MNAFLRAAICCLPGCLAFAVQACPFTIAYSDRASPPYYLGDGETVPANPGIAVELVNLAAAKMGCKIEWQRLPGRRALRDLETGKVNAMLLLSYSAERAVYAVYPMAGEGPDPALSLAALHYSVYVKNGSSLKWDGKQFNQTPGAIGAIGANAGHSVVQDLRKLGFTVDEAPGMTNNLMKLLAGRIAAYVGQDLQTDLYIEEEHIMGVQKMPTPYSSKNYYLPFSKPFFGTSAASANQLWKQIADEKKAHGKELTKKYVNVN